MADLSIPPQPPLLMALAVLGWADGELLSTMIDGQAEDDDTPLLDAHPQIERDAGGWRLDPEAASILRNDLVQADPAFYQALHERALTLLLERLRAGDLDCEAQLLTVLDRLATHLIPHEPARLVALFATVQDAPLATAHGQQLRSYVQGLSYLRADQPHAALEILNRLLADLALDLQIRRRSLNSRAWCHQVLGRIEEAMTDLWAGLVLCRQADDRLNEGKALLNLGIMAYELQAYEEAEAHLRSAEQCFQAIGSAQMVAAVQNELGLVYRDQGRWADALHALQASADQARREGATDALATELLNIGEVLLLQGRLSEAEETLQEAFIVMQTRTYQVDLYLGLGLARQVQGKLAAAQAAYEAALACATAIDRRDILAQVYFRLGEVLRQQGEDEAALALLEKAAGAVEQTRAPIHEEGLKIGLLGRWQQIYERLVLHCLQLGRFEEAWRWSERARARAFVEQITPPATTSPPSSFSTLERGDLAAVQAALGPGGLLLDYFTTGVFDHHTPFWRALAADNPVRAHVLTPARTVLFVITATSIAVYECPVDPNAFASSSRRHEDRSRFLTPKLLAQLSKVLLPIELPAHLQQLYFTPHGPLHHIPFVALQDATGQPLLRADGPALVYAPSAALLHQQGRHRTGRHDRQPCLAIGYAGERHALQHAVREAQLIAALTGGVVWTGGDSQNLRTGVSKCRWLHFACHGWFDYATPLASYLEIGLNARLTADEVLREWRLDADLVTLSACQTGVHRLLRGDEPMGLIRGFLAAGARAVIASQWPVDDLATFLLMGRLYEQLVADPAGDPARALRDAQVWLRAVQGQQLLDRIETLGITSPRSIGTTDCPFTSPQYWAGFVIFTAS